MPVVSARIAEFVEPRISTELTDYEFLHRPFLSSLSVDLLFIAALSPASAHQCPSLPDHRNRSPWSSSRVQKVQKPEEAEDAVVRRIIVSGSGWTVSGSFGPGLPESAIEASSGNEMRNRGLKVAQQVVFPLIKKGSSAIWVILARIAEFV